MKARDRLASAKLSTPLAILITVVTLGIYAPVWYLRRREFFRAADRGNGLGSLPFVDLGLTLLNLGIAAFEVIEPNRAGPGSNIVSFAGGIVGLVLAFRARRLLETYFSRIGMPRRLSGAAV